jgi:pimeloyl-ACP methyl ester carboxylesterase
MDRLDERWWRDAGEKRHAGEKVNPVMTPAVPPPTGRLPVGRTVRQWTDPLRADPYAADPSERRSLVAWMWYPRARSPDAVAPYLPAAWQPAGQPLGIRADGLSAHSVDGAAIDDENAPYPVVLLSPSGFPPLLLSGTAEELASHGFVVVGVNHTYETAVTVFPDGRTVAMNPAAIAGALGPQSGAYQAVFERRADVCRYKAVDLAFVADRLAELGSDDPLAGRLDLGRLTAMGHSFGGAAALQWCRDDPRCTAAVNLDGALWTDVGRLGLPRPVLQVLAVHREFDATPHEAVEAGMAPNRDWYVAERAITLDGWATVDRTGRPAHSVQIAGATHLSFMDVPFLPLAPDSPARAMLAQTTIDPAHMRALTSTLLVAFLSGADMAAVLAAEPVRTAVSPLRGADHHPAASPPSPARDAD